MFDLGTPLARRLTYACTLASLILAAASPTALAQEESSDAELTLEDLQRQIDELRAQQQDSPKKGSSDVTMKVFGRIHFDAWGFTSTDRAINAFDSIPPDPSRDPRNNFEFRRARWGASGTVYDDMLYKFEVDFGKPDSFVMKDMYLGFKDLGFLQKVLIGNQKRPYGLDHLNSSRFNVFIERPYVIEANNQDSRRLGIASYGVSKDQAWNWRAGVYHLNDVQSFGDIVSDTFQPEVTGRIANTAWWDEETGGESYAHWAVSGSLAWPDPNPSLGDLANQARFRTRPEARSTTRWIDTGAIAGADEYELLGLEGVVNLGPTQITAEYQKTWVERNGGMSDLQFDGGYIYASYFLTGEHMPWNRKSGTLGRPKPHKNFSPGNGWGAWQVGARLSLADYSDQDIFGGAGESITLGLNWYWNPNASVQVNYIRGEISERQVVVGPETFTEGDYSVLGIRFRVDF